VETYKIMKQCDGVMRGGVIYLILCLKNLKVYVGQTRNFDQRIHVHFSESHRLCLAHDINEYGLHNFMSVIILAGIKRQDALDMAEMALIRHSDCMVPENMGYNLACGGSRNANVKTSFSV